MEKILRSKCLSLCAVFTTLILWCGVVATQQPASEILSRFDDDSQVERVIGSALKVSEKYSSDEYINCLLNADHYKSVAQHEMNEHLFARLSLLPNFEVGIYAKDFMKSGFLGVEWFFEWIIYKWFCEHTVCAMFDHITAHIDDYVGLAQCDEVDNFAEFGKKIQKFGPYTGTLQHLQSFFDKKFIFFIANIMIISQLIYKSKQSLFLVQEPSFAGLFNVAQSINKPVSAFTFIERHPILSLPIDPSRGGMTAAINMMFKSCGLLPDWIDRWYVKFGTEISFLLFFLTRVQMSHFSICWTAWTIKSFPTLRALLIVYKKTLSNSEATIQEREEVKKVLRRYIAQGLNISFLHWMSCKVFWHGIWQAAVNCTFALPAWVKLGKGAHQLWKTTQTSGDDMEIV